MSKDIKSFPDFLSSDDLVSLGLYASRDAVYSARIRGYSPDFIQIGRRILYPKNCVEKFIEINTKKGNIPKVFLSMDNQQDQY